MIKMTVIIFMEFQSPEFKPSTLRLVCSWMLWS